MVGGGGIAPIEELRQLLGLLAGRGVDDRRSAGGVVENAAGELTPRRRANLDDLDRDVVATETVDEPLWLVQAQLLGDVVLDPRGGGRRQRKDGSRA